MNKIILNNFRRKLNSIVLLYFKILFRFFYYMNKNKFLKCENLFFFRNKRYFVGNGFGHYSLTAFFLKSKQIKNVLVIDFFDHYKQKINYIFDIPTIKFSLKKIFFFNLSKKNEKKFFNYCKKLVNHKKIKIIDSIDDLYFNRNKEKNFFFDEYNSINAKNMHRFYRLQNSKHKFWMRFIHSDNKDFDLNTHINLNKMKKIKNELNINLDPNKKNLVFFHRYKNTGKDYILRKGYKDLRSGAGDHRYYEKIFEHLSSLNLNVFIIGDFNKNDLIKIKSKFNFNVCENLKKQNKFYIFSICISDFLIGEHGGACELPMILRKKTLLFNFTNVGDILPNTLIYPKNFKKISNGLTTMNLDDIIRYRNINDKLKPKIDCSLVDIEKLNNLIQNFIEENYEKKNESKNYLIEEMKKNNSYFFNDWLLNHNI